MSMCKERLLYTTCISFVFAVKQTSTTCMRITHVVLKCGRSKREVGARTCPTPHTSIQIIKHITSNHRR